MIVCGKQTFSNTRVQCKNAARVTDEKWMTVRITSMDEKSL